MFNCVKTAKSVQNRNIELFCRKGKGKDKGRKNILVIGSMHGDEPQGADILNLYVKENNAAINNVCVIPCLNPDGYFRKSRTNANGVDINRNFPTKNWIITEQNEFFGGNKPASEPETSFLIDCIEDIQPDLILTIHAPFKIVNFDGEALTVSEKIGEIIGYPVQQDIGYPTPGSFGTYCGIEKKIPTITLELGEDEDFAFQKDSCFKILEYLSLLN